jgi:hypothetical protein
VNNPARLPYPEAGRVWGVHAVLGRQSPDDPAPVHPVVAVGMEQDHRAASSGEQEARGHPPDFHLFLVELWQPAHRVDYPSRPPTRPLDLPG